MPLQLPQREPCPFCENLLGRIASDSSGIKQWAFIERLDSVAAFVNPYQFSPGTVLVVTTRHASTILDLNESEAQATASSVQRVARAVYEAFDPAGLNIFQNNGIASGQSIPHYHVHIVPRYPGDKPELLLGKDAVLIEFDERVRIADRIAEPLQT